MNSIIHIVKHYQKTLKTVYLNTTIIVCKVNIIRTYVLYCFTKKKYANVFFLSKYSHY